MTEEATGVGELYDLGGGGQKKLGIGGFDSCVEFSVSMDTGCRVFGRVTAVGLMGSKVVLSGLANFL